MELVEANLDDKPLFEALSYTWDLTTRLDFLNDFEEIRDKGEQRPVLCNGKTVHITMNLYLALIEFRRMKLETALWSDQICINQQDSLEKIPQLAIMEQIYSSASAVVIWLDTLNTVRNWALDFMESLPDGPKGTTLVTTDPPMQQSVFDKINRPFKAAKEISDSLGKHSRWIAVMLALSCGWFDRIWTLQEFMLAKRFRILMGNREIPQSALVNAATQVFDFYATDSLSVQVGINNLTNGDLGSLAQNRTRLFEERTKFQNGKRYSAAEYLVIARRKEATVSKDLVFAGAGLLEQGVPDSVNYFSTTREVYSAFAVERLWPQTEIESLTFVGGTSPKVEGLPSWVPDLSTELIPQPLRYSGCQILDKAIAPGLTRFTIHAQTLSMIAAKWNSVGEVGESLWSWTNWGYQPYNTEEGKRGTAQISKIRMKTSTTDSRERFGLMFALLEGMGEVYAPTEECPMDALWKTLLGGATLAHEDDSTIWRDRFYNFLALTYLDIRSVLEAKKKSTSAPDPWKVSLVQDLPNLVERVSSLINAYDRPSWSESDQSLKQVVSDLTNRLYGGDTSKGGLSELRAAFRGDPSHEPASLFGDLFTKVYDGRQIFSTPNGYLGISTEDVKPEDVIMLVAGADVPYVLRPVAGVQSTFTLVGEAYVHGLTAKGSLNETDLLFGDIQIV